MTDRDFLLNLAALLAKHLNLADTDPTMLRLHELADKVGKVAHEHSRGNCDECYEMFKRGVSAGTMYDGS